MARAYKCDRCGRFYEVNLDTKDKAEVTVFCNYNGIPQVCKDTLDLCIDCQDKLIDFLNYYKGNGENSDNQTIPG